MLLGASLVTIGVLVAALADRIRCLRVSREMATIQGEGCGQPTITPLEGGGSSQVSRARVPRSTPAASATVQPNMDSPEDVIAALVAAGYKRQIAAEAAIACSGSERATIEDWTRAALRRLARGVS